MHIVLNYWHLKARSWGIKPLRQFWGKRCYCIYHAWHLFYNVLHSLYTSFICWDNGIVLLLEWNVCNLVFAYFGAGSSWENDVWMWQLYRYCFCCLCLSMYGNDFNCSSSYIIQTSLLPEWVPLQLTQVALLSLVSFRYCVVRWLFPHLVHRGFLLQRFSCVVVFDTWHIDVFLALVEKVAPYFSLLLNVRIYLIIYVFVIYGLFQFYEIQ